MEKHFHAWNTCPPVCVLRKNLETNTWQGPDPLVTRGREYACVFPEHEQQPRWLSLQCIKPVTAIYRTHEKALVRKPTMILSLTEKEEVNSMSYSDLGRSLKN
jgi:hypothetical protein